jgi:hypothetical protein
MKKALMTAAFLVATLTAMEVSACNLYVTVICPNDNTSGNISVCATSADGTSTTCGVTDANGLVHLLLPKPDTYTICVDPTTLPPGATLNKPNLCQTTFVPDVGPGVAVEFELSGPFCKPVISGLCWMTGGGNIGTGKTPDYSYGGVVYPGCSPTAADGGNWNVVDHAASLHFQGKHIVVDDCLGAPTKSPKVTVRVIDFSGTGTIVGIGGNPLATLDVAFVGRAIDNHDGGAGSDQLYLKVVDINNAATVLMQIGASADSPATVSTGNIQIHQSSCGK